MPLTRHATSPTSASRANPLTPSPRRAPRATLGNLLLSPHASSAASAASTASAANDVQHAIELLDSSDDDTAPPGNMQPPHTAHHLDLDDVVTPELPPADASAPTLPASIVRLCVTPEPPSEQPQLDLLHTAQPSPSPEPLSPPKPPPDPLANQRPIFDHEGEMQPIYDELAALLQTEQPSDGEDNDEDYEQRRQRKLRANAALLAQLGLAPTNTNTNPMPLNRHMPNCDDEPLGQPHPLPRQTNHTAARGRGRPKKRQRVHPSVAPDDADASRLGKKKKYDRKVKFADDGTTKFAPLPGETFDLAYVDVSALRDRARNDYVFIRDVPEIRPEDLVTWSEDEDEEEEEEEEDDADAEVEIEADRVDANTVDVYSEPIDVVAFDSLGRIKSKRRKRQPNVLPDGTIMSSCHQCRRKTSSLKMRCHRMRKGVQCSLMFCERCVTVRYGIEFDATDPNFQCPRCLGYCSCTKCLVRSDSDGKISRGGRCGLVNTKQLTNLEGGFATDNFGARIDSILFDRATLGMDGTTPKKRGRPRKVVNNTNTNPNTNPAISVTPKRRGRPPKKQDNAPKPAPPQPQLMLSDDVAEGDVFSELEEYALGRLHVARRVLRLIASKQTTKRIPKTQIPEPERCKTNMLVKLKRPAPKASRPTATMFDEGVGQKRKMPNYHDREKDVWVRSAADSSPPSSDEDEVSTNGDDDGDGDDDDDEDDGGGGGGEDGEDGVEGVFEEGHTQVFVSSRLQFQPMDNTSSAASQASSPLTSLDDTLESSSTASSGHDEDEEKDDTQHSEFASEPNPPPPHNHFPPELPTSPLELPHDMQQLALAILEDPRPDKSTCASSFVAPTEVSTPFGRVCGSEGGNLGGWMDVDAGLFGEDAFSGV